jgi:Regulator of chromosome condensation (RCC1) repeat
MTACRGWNRWGEAGIGTCDCLLLPKRVTGLAGRGTVVTAVAAGARHTVSVLTVVCVLLQLFTDS